MPVVPNNDDYYAQVPVTSGAEDTSTKTGALKLKIKAKKPAELTDAPIPSNTPAPIPDKNTEEKKSVFKPTISFEAAPKIETPVRAATTAPAAAPAFRPSPRSTTHAPSKSGSHPDEFYSSTPRPAAVTSPAGEQKRSGFPFDPNKNFKVRTAQTPRISFAPAPVRAPAAPVASATKTPTGTPGSPNKLQAYAKSHQDAPKRGRNTVGPKGVPDYTKPKKGFKTVSAAWEDDGKFRRGKKISRDQRAQEEIKQTLVDRTGQEISLPEMLTVKEFSEKIGVPLPKLVGELMKNGMMATVNTKIDYDTCYLIGEGFGVKITKEISTDASVNDIITGNIEALLKNDDPEKLTPRAPIISIMGHVDHGKTSILDYIRKSQVVASEAGGITQKIGAYQVDRNGKKITFLDTPGHEAFSIMRSRGAKLTDLAIIVIAADEGMKPQTIESINHAKEAEIPMLIAVNKMDKPGANLDLIRGQLSEQGLQPEDWGGSTVVVPVSAHTGLGIETLLDMVLLLTDMMDLKAHPTRPAVATVIESHLDAKMGALSTVLVNAGILRKGDCITCAQVSGRVRALRDYRGKNVDEAGPGTPVQVVGLSEVVEGGDILQVMPDSDTASSKAQEFLMAKGKKSIHNFEWASLSLLMTRIKTGSLKQLKVVLKCDSNGSLEALKASLGKLSTSETQVAFIHTGVGEINESDVLMAGTSQALLVAYNVSVNLHARQTLANSKIEFIDKKVIYHIIERIEAIITGMVDLKHEEVAVGVAEVKAIFFTGKDRLVVGMWILEGVAENRAKIRVVRNGEKVGWGEILNLKSGPSDVHEIEAGQDCGISFKGDIKVEVGDRLEMYKMVIKK